MPRPIELFHGFCGQPAIVQAIRTHCAGAIQRSLALPHMLLGGPSGMGKTHLAHATAAELGTRCIGVFSSKDARRPAMIEKLSSVKFGDIFFVDEIHALPIESQELLYPAIDRQQIPKLEIEKKRTVENGWIDIPKFTLIAATDQPGHLRHALQQRIVLRFTLTEYAPREMRQIALNYAAELGVLLTPQSATVIASACRGTPRRARHMLESLNLCLKEPQAPVTASAARKHLLSLGIDALGLTPDDRRCLRILAERGSPISADNLARALGLDRAALQREVEPFLIQRGWLGTASCGRFLTPAGQALVAGRGLR